MRHSDLILLGLLAEGPQHAYSLNQQIESMQVTAWARISQATVYRRLDRLEEEGFLGSEREREGSRPERTVYHLTPAGEERLEELVREALSSRDPPYSDRLVGGVFARAVLPGAEAREVLTEAIEEAGEKDRRLAGAAQRRISPVGEAIVEFYGRIVAAETELLRRLRSLAGQGRGDR